MEFRVNLDLDLLTKLERERSVKWDIGSNSVTLTLSPGGVDPVLSENKKLRELLEWIRDDLLDNHNCPGDPSAYDMDTVQAINEVLGRPVEDVS